MNRYLVAQTPLPDTVEDFLTLIIQEKVSCIISMADYSSDKVIRLVKYEGYNNKVLSN